MTLTIMNRLRAEAHRPKPRTAIISITNPDGPEAALANGYAAIHREQFWDITEVETEGGTAYFPIDAAQAEAILAFTREWLPQIDHLIVHCEAGISRSAGTAVALAEIFGLCNADELARRYWAYNRTVATAIWDATITGDQAPRGGVPCEIAPTGESQTTLDLRVRRSQGLTSA